MIRNIRSTGIGITLALASCASPKTTLLTLDAAPPPPNSVYSDYRGLPIAVPAVHLPASLDRPEFVREVTAGEVSIDDFARWTAPLGLLVRDTLVQDLTARLPAGSVLPPAAVGSTAHARTIDVTILSFHAGAEDAAMQVAYRELPNGAVQILSLSAPSTGVAPVPTAAAFGDLLGQLADRIAMKMAVGSGLS